ncbi:TolC family protein [Burkholderia pseudomultivorans]|uniref:RND transporter n=1 Tax=Burkholderia aenigmatica TaxID=2015348 RepID=A0A228HMK5_9BURK|nr:MULTISPECIES: TolC family protein [Burkholderia cepacia complex]MBR8142735.1 TolC family protein [Burkholderia vietnamiensis]MBU9439594.1 TolC family protein [Burkholderia multivorans]MBU9565006.1 TolC family protein [Burkholderia multivorans]MBU9680815.1 TolC family protein [Burkholderia multivorans]MCO8623738.1 TolC family protein [Burkholderia multivorans]
MTKRYVSTRMGAGIAVMVFLAGCTTFSKDGGFNTVSSTAKERLGKDAVIVKTDADRDAAAKRTQELVGKPLSMDDAVQVALLNNRGLQASYAELGLSEADLVQAGRLPNPGFTFSRTRAGNGDLSIGRMFSANVLSILTLPFAAHIEGRRFEQTKLEAADAMLKVAADARRAYINAVAAEQAARYADQVKDSADAGTELASRMRQAGNFSKLDYAREQAFYADAVAQSAKTHQQAVVAREKLTRIMGLWGAGTQYTLPDRLPDLPKQRPDLNDLESYAMQNRLDIQAAKLQTQSVASSMGLSKATRFINALDVGYQNNYETDKGHEHGYEISVEIPIFDFGSAKVARAEATYMRSANQLAQTAIDARSEVRESYSAYVTSYDVAKHYRDEVVPIRKTISDELLLRYNGMLASVFELLADSREQVGAVNSYIDALKDYWLAETDLQQAVGGRLPQAGDKQDSKEPAPQRPVVMSAPNSTQPALQSTSAPAAQSAPAMDSEGK